MTSIPLVLYLFICCSFLFLYFMVQRLYFLLFILFMLFFIWSGRPDGRELAIFLFIIWKIFDRLCSTLRRLRFVENRRFIHFRDSRRWEGSRETFYGDQVVDVFFWLWSQYLVDNFWRVNSDVYIYVLDVWWWLDESHSCGSTRWIQYVKFIYFMFVFMD